MNLDQFSALWHAEKNHVSAVREVVSKVRRIEVRQVARAFDVPPWLISSEIPRPRFARLRWALRRFWKV